MKRIVCLAYTSPRPHLNQAGDPPFLFQIWTCHIISSRQNLNKYLFSVVLEGNDLNLSNIFGALEFVVQTYQDLHILP